MSTMNYPTYAYPMYVVRVTDDRFGDDGQRQGIATSIEYGQSTS